MSVTVETNQPFVPQPVQQPVCNLVHADREEWIKVVSKLLMLLRTKLVVLITMIVLDRR